MNAAPSPETTPLADRPAGSGRAWRIGTLVYTVSGLVALFGWLLWGDFVWQLKERAAPPILQILLRRYEASDLLVGVFLLSLPAAVGFVFTPLISYHSDRHRGRWGRRVPYLIVAAPVATVSMCALALSPRIGSWLHGHFTGSVLSQNASIVVVLGVAWTFFEFATIAANALFQGLINDVVPRPIIGRFFGLFRVVGLSAGILFNQYLLGHAGSWYAPLLMGLGLTYGVGIVVMCLRVKEGDYPPPDPAGTRPPGPLDAVRLYLRECFADPYYRWIYAALALGALGFVPVNLFGMYAAGSFGVSLERFGHYHVIIYTVSMILAYPLGILADRWHPLRLGLATLGAHAAAMILGFFVVRDGKTFAWFYVIHGILAGGYLTGTAGLALTLFPKLTFAQFASAGGLVFSATFAAGGPLFGLILDTLQRDYRFIFGLGGFVGSIALGVTLVVHRKCIRRQTIPRW